MHIGTKKKKLDISSEKDTQKISKKFSKFLSKGDFIFLYGEIGVGKTTFIKHLINFLQLKSNLEITEVPSPTFNLVYDYKIKDLYIRHFDLYRIKNEKELVNIGLFEYQNDAITFIEWPEIILKKPKKIIELTFTYEKNLTKRNLFISSRYKKKLINEFK